MKTKKILAAIAALAIVFGAVPTQPFADVIGNMAITASAETSEDDFSFSDGVILEYYGSETEVVIPSTIGGVTVTSIGVDAFLGSSVTSITIPDSVTSIGVSAFENCSSLTEITIPDSVTSIGVSAFGNCSSLTSITIPDSVTKISWMAFYGCSSLTSITIPDNVITLGDNDGDVFDGCTKLKSITAPCRFKNNEEYSSVDNAVSSGATVTWSHVFEDGVCTVCSEEQPRNIKGIGYILEGQIGIRLATDLSADKLVVMCGDKTIDLTQKDGYVEFYLSAQDMAKEYTVYYVDGEIEIAKFNPKNNLSGYKDTEYEAVAEALITYCEAANANFNGGTVADYSREWESVKSAIGENTVDMGENYYGSSLLLESNTIVRHYYTEDAEGRIKKGNYYYVEEAVDPTKFAATGTYSVNDYIYKALTSEKADTNLKNLCVTLYKYGVAAEKYIGGTK